MEKTERSKAHPKGEGRGSSRPNKILLLLVFIMFAFNLHQQTISTGLYYDTAAAQTSSAALLYHDDTNSLWEEDEASRIIRRSYEKSYALILPCDDEDDHPSSSEKSCMKKTLDYFNQPPSNNSTVVPSIPWWFQTLLRDTQNNGAYGFWHHFYTSEPAFNFCTIGKVATTEWRRVFCKLNANDCIDDPIKLCGKKKCAWRTKKEMPENAPWAVFLRDPLERLLSGYLDKCYTPGTRSREKHCEPNIVFNLDPDLRDAKNNDRPFPSLIAHLEDKDKQMFGAYLDVLPLKWNVHFVPQAIACGLHRDIGNYDFVGNMGRDFMFELERMADQFGGQLPEVLNSSFGYKEQVKLGKKNTGRDKNQHATHAPAKVAKFYTAQTVRRGLELLSIDYVTLGLKVPEWARQMLRDDVA